VSVDSDIRLCCLWKYQSKRNNIGSCISGTIISWITVVSNGDSYWRWTA